MSGSGIGGSTAKDCSNGNHGLGGHIGIIVITNPGCVLILLSSLKIGAIGGKTYASLHFHLEFRASTASASWNLALDRNCLHFTLFLGCQ